MKRWWLAAVLAYAGCVVVGSPSTANAQSTPAAQTARATAPTDARIDALLDTLEMERTLADMLAQMDTMSETLGQQMLGEGVTPAQRAEFERLMSKQHERMRESMSWEKMAPIYRRVYKRLFTAEEVEAMIAFYGGDTGRGIMRKMPQAIGLTMEEMGPIMRELMGELQKSLESEFERPVDTAPSR